jgi:hypothetical protein
MTFCNVVQGLMNLFIALEHLVEAILLTCRKVVGKFLTTWLWRASPRWSLVILRSLHSALVQPDGDTLFRH